MNIRWAWMPLFALLAAQLAVPELRAQQGRADSYDSGAESAPGGAPGYPQGPMAGPMGMAPGMYAPSPGMYSQSPYAPSGAGYGYGPPGYGVSPASYMSQDMQAQYDAAGEGGACQSCGGQGCPSCGVGNGGIIGDLLGLVGPYGDGGYCAPRWYDLYLDAMWLKRDDTGRNIPLSSVGVAGPIVLQTRDFNFEHKPSFRFVAAFQTSATANLEFQYFGLFNWQSRVQVRGDDNLFSSLSQFGVLPPGGFAEEGAGNYHRAEYSSSFDNFEVNYRNRWQGPDCRYQGSWLMGIRYFQLDEDFDFITNSVVNDARMNYNVNTNNALTGFQWGGDVWMTILPGLRMGMEGRAGVFGNHMNVSSDVRSTLTTTRFVETLKSNQVAFVGDASLLTTYRINERWTLRGGYMFMFVDGVALAPENFNRVPSDVIFPITGLNRRPFVNGNGNVFYHGANVGLEFLW